MVRYCSDPDCRRYRIPLPPDGGPCPDCGAVEYRLDPDVSTYRCQECEAPNAGAHGECWECGADLGRQTRLSY